MLDKNFIASEIIPQEPGSTVRVRMHGKERRVELLRGEVDKVFHGGEDSPLRWWCDGLRPLAAQLTAQGFTTSAPNLMRLLNAMGVLYSEGRLTREAQLPAPARGEKFRGLAERIARGLATGDAILTLRSERGNALEAQQTLALAMIEQWWQAAKANERPPIRILVLVDGFVSTGTRETTEWLSRAGSQMRVAIEPLALPRGHFLLRSHRVLLAGSVKGHEHGTSLTLGTIG
jgi:hypothetical protein